MKYVSRQKLVNFEKIINGSFSQNICNCDTFASQWKEEEIREKTTQARKIWRRRTKKRKNVS